MKQKYKSFANIRADIGEGRARWYLATNIASIFCCNKTLWSFKIPLYVPKFYENTDVSQ